MDVTSDAGKWGALSGLTNPPRPAPVQPIPAAAELAYPGRVFQVFNWRQRQANGTTQQFEGLARRDTVLVLPIDADGRVLLGHEKQPGSRRILHALGGRVEEGETSGSAAARELKEEAGLVADQWALWYCWQPVNKVDWAVYIFWARGLESVESSPEVGEDVTIRAVDGARFADYSVIDLLDDRELEHVLGLAAAGSSKLPPIGHFLSDGRL